MFIKIKGRLYSLPNLKTISDEDFQNEMKNYLILTHTHIQNFVSCKDDPFYRALTMLIRF